MDLELWTPERQQLKTIAADWMTRRMGDGWRGELHTDESDWSVRAILGWRGRCCYFLMTASVEPREKALGNDKPCGVESGERGQRVPKLPEHETLTAQLYRDSLGTALLDSGRKLLQIYVEQRQNASGNQCEQRQKTLEDQYESSIINKRYKLCGPGLDGVPLETMKGLYEALEGWRIGISINKFGVLMPEKSCGGWYEAVEDDRVDVSNRLGFGEAHGNCKIGTDGCGGFDGADSDRRVDAASGNCQPGPGCLFCQLRDGRCKNKENK